MAFGGGHDVEEVLSCPTIHYGIEEPLEGDCDGLCVRVCGEGGRGL